MRILGRRKRQTALQILIALLRLLVEQPTVVTSFSRGVNTISNEDFEDIMEEDLVDDWGDDDDDDYYDEDEYEDYDDDDEEEEDGVYTYHNAHHRHHAAAHGNDDYYSATTDEDEDAFGYAQDEEEEDDEFDEEDEEEEFEDDEEPPPPPSKKHRVVLSTTPTCAVYYAESTIPGAGFGIFAGRDFREGDLVTPGDLAVPTIDLPWHYGYRDDYEYDFLWNEYNWDDSGFPFMEDEGMSISVSSFGIGALPNCFFPLINMQDTKTNIDTAGLHRSRDPGAGGFTPYHGRQGLATRDIPAGMELLVDYGESYFQTREQQYGPIPLPEDYHAGDNFLRHYASFIEYLLDKRVDVHSSLFGLIHEMKEIWQSHVLYSLPEDPSRLDETLSRGTGNTFYDRSIRDLEWLEEHGTCMDHLRAGLSTIRQAGRGAFARRDIKKGDIVTPVPLIHVADRDMLNMYQAKQPGHHPHSSRHVRDKDSPIHKQLLLNYCFGHPESSILLCSYGITSNLINHSKERANAKVVWSTKSMRRPEWLEQPPSQWVESLVAGLAFDFVATEDIKEGDEVFIDYGDAWEKAWNEHVQNFANVPDRSPSYLAAHELHTQDDSIIKTAEEGSYDTKEVQLKIHEHYRLMRGLYPDEPHMQEHPCRVIKRYTSESGEILYWVEVLEHEDVEWDLDERCYEHRAEIMFDVPRDAFTFSDAFGSRDHAQPWSFRHHLGIPDEIMPAAWLDRKAAV